MEDKLFTTSGYITIAVISTAVLFIVTDHIGLSVIAGLFAPLFLTFGYFILSFFFVMVMHIVESFVDAVKNSPSVVFIFLAIILPGIVANTFQNEILLGIATLYYIGLFIAFIGYNSGWTGVLFTFGMIILMLILR